MDMDFIAELDNAITNLGADKVWKRTVGGVEIWLSPITVIGHVKVQEVLNNAELGPSIVIEGKRETLAHAIVGFDKYDLREYRHSAPVFPGRSRDGKPIKVTLERYIYDKLASWGQEFVANLFDVYADLMETHKQENLKDVKFEHLKSPVEELGELMARVAELREQLGLPELVEKTETDEAESAPEAPTPATPRTSAKAFDPFSVPEKADDSPGLHVGDLPEDVRPKYVPQQAPVIRGASTKEPVPVEVKQAAAQAEADEFEIMRSSTPASTLPQEQLRDDVLETPSPKQQVEPPQIDRIQVARNPRFAHRPK